ncbi:MAG: hypothetical protein JWN99_2681 [Ilumatobacteraceae bacterium]|nr:hypothetical protein [Ilumatobacteraceae bacterium]
MPAGFEASSCWSRGCVRACQRESPVVSSADCRTSARSVALQGDSFQRSGQHVVWARLVTRPNGSAATTSRSPVRLLQMTKTVRPSTHRHPHSHGPLTECFRATRMLLRGSGRLLVAMLPVAGVAACGGPDRTVELSIHYRQLPNGGRTSFSGPARNSVTTESACSCSAFAWHLAITSVESHPQDRHGLLRGHGDSRMQACRMCWCAICRMTCTRVCSSARRLLGSHFSSICPRSSPGWHRRPAWMMYSHASRAGTVGGWAWNVPSPISTRSVAPVDRDRRVGSCQRCRR